jgi:hypothetical protein
MDTEIFLAPIENFYYNATNGKYIYQIDSNDYNLPNGFYIHKANHSSVKIIQKKDQVQMTEHSQDYLQLQHHIDLMWNKYEQNKKKLTSTSTGTSTSKRSRQSESISTDSGCILPRFESKTHIVFKLSSM